MNRGDIVINRITKEEWYVAQVDRDNNQAIIVADNEGICMINIKLAEVDYILPKYCEYGD